MAWIADKELSTYQKRIRNDLLQQLEQQGKGTSYYRDMVNDYIVMMRTRDQLQEKIKDLGTMVPYSSNGVMTWKKNDAVEQFNKTCDRMAKHLDFLGLKPDETLKEDEDDAL
jgi:hypothetical protein